MSNLHAELEQVRHRQRQLQHDLDLCRKREQAILELLDENNGAGRADAQLGRDDGLRARMAAQTLESLTPTEIADLSEVKALVELALVDQNGCREAQRALDQLLTDDERVVAQGLDPSRTYSKRDLLVMEMGGCIVQLLCDPYGNYFAQRMFSRANPGELLMFIDALGHALPEASCNMHGTRGIQKLLECCTTDEQFELFCEYAANELVTMSNDLNANHVVQRLLLNSKCGEKEREALFHLVTHHCVEISMNRQGCCLIQRCIEAAPEFFRNETINTVISNALQLVQDPFGNYVIQFVLDLKPGQLPPAEGVATPTASNSVYANRIIRQLLHHIASLSCDKFSSNVVEKCLRCASPEVRQLLLDELIDPLTLPKLLTQSYANYVIQTAISVSDDSQFTQLRDAIHPLQHLLRNSPYGVKIEHKMAKRARDSARRRGNGGHNGGRNGGGHRRNLSGGHSGDSSTNEHPGLSPIAGYGGPGYMGYHEGAAVAPTQASGFVGSANAMHMMYPQDNVAATRQHQQQQQRQQWSPHGGEYFPGPAAAYNVHGMMPPPRMGISIGGNAAPMAGSQHPVTQHKPYEFAPRS